MNFVWVCVVSFSLIVLMIFNPNIAFNTIILGSEKAINLVIKLWAIYAVWLGVLKIMEDTGIDKKFAKLFSPLTRKLIGKFDTYTENQISINITSNLLGLGNASVPSGINAIKGMYKGGNVATNPMLVFFILNTCNLQIIPSTIIGLRILAGSVNASDIILPTIISSFASIVVGLGLLLICSKIFKRAGS